MKKKTYIRLLSLLLCVAMLCGTMTACGGGGETMMKLGDQKLSVNIYELMLSRYRGTMEYSYPDAAQDQFWDIVIDSSGVTYNDYFTASILDNAKTYICAMYVHDEVEGLTLPEETIKGIDEELRTMIDELADGSKTAFNAQIAAYGVNYQMLRDAYIMEAKIMNLQNTLYGVDGALLSDVVKEEYYQKNYVRFKHVFFFTYGAVYETDENGDAIYYNDNDSIAYDKTNGTTKTDENGNTVKDANGDPVYYTADGRISYDKKNGLRAYVYDKNGYVTTRKYTDEEIELARGKAEQIYQMAQADYDFDELVEIYNEDQGLDEYTNGFYLTPASEYEVEVVKEAVQEMKVGEIRLIESDFGFHVVKRYELDEGAYHDTVNADFFSDMTQNIMTDMFLKLVNQYADRVEVNEELVNSIEIRDVAANYYY